MFQVGFETLRVKRKSADFARVVFRYFPQSWTSCSWQAHFPESCFDESVFFPSGDFFEVVSHSPGTNDTSVVRSILIEKNSASIDEWISSQDMVFRSFVMILVNHTFNVKVAAFIGKVTRHV